MNDRTFPLEAAPTVGQGQCAEKMQGHWLLARAGKRVLRPGGLPLTRRMLRALTITPEDRVVEFAPGLGVTAEMVLSRRPAKYWAVERETAAAEQLRRWLPRTAAEVVMGSAESSGLPDHCATAVFGEAMLTMQSNAQKNRIVAEARRLLTPGGRYAIHELCLVPDEIPGSVRQEIQAAMSKEIHVGVQPLCRSEWVALMEQNGFKVIWNGEEPMHLLEPSRLLKDEGLRGMLRMAFNLAVHSALRRRVLAMRRLFRKYGDHLQAISLVSGC
jgi:SAM-dependent methyltransferase